MVAQCLLRGTPSSLAPCIAGLLEHSENRLESTHYHMCVHHSGQYCGFRFLAPGGSMRPFEEIFVAKQQRLSPSRSPGKYFTPSSLLIRVQPLSVSSSLYCIRTARGTIASCIASSRKPPATFLSSKGNGRSAMSAQRHQSGIRPPEHPGAAPRSSSATPNFARVFPLPGAVAATVVARYIFMEGAGRGFRNTPVTPTA